MSIGSAVWGSGALKKSQSTALVKTNQICCEEQMFLIVVHVLVAILYTLQSFS